MESKFTSYQTDRQNIITRQQILILHIAWPIKKPRQIEFGGAFVQTYVLIYSSLCRTVQLYALIYSSHHLSQIAFRFKPRLAIRSPLLGQ